MEHPQQKPGNRRGDDRPERVHHSLEAECASVSFGRYRRGEQRLAHRRTHAATKPRACASYQDLPSGSGEAKRCCAKCCDSVTEHGDRLAPLEPICVITRCDLRKARKTIAYALN